MGPHDRLAQKKTLNWAPIAAGGKIRHNLHNSLAQQFVIVVTAPPLVGCVVWSLSLNLLNGIDIKQQLSINLDSHALMYSCNILPSLVRCSVFSTR